MKGFTFGFFVALTALPTLAATGNISRVIPGTNIEMKSAFDTGARTDTENSTGAVMRSVARGTAASESQTRTAVTRNTSRSVVTEIPETTRVANRSAAVSRSQTNTDARSTLESAVRNSGRSTRTEAAGINANPAVRRLGLTLRPSTAEVGGRATLASGAQTGSNMDSEIRNLQSSRVATVKSRDNTKLDPTAIAEAKDRLEQTAALNKSCQDQYNDCMDQFCAVIDANQKRCSCSSNLSKYAKVEKAVKDANTELNEVAQNIRYVGLSADEISAIMSATEAEEAMTGKTDTTENRTLLAQIEQMIKEPTSNASASMSSDSYGLLDIDLDFSSSELNDLFSLDFLSNNNSSFSNLRGADLYNAAKKRCNTVINQCKEVGATAQQITGNYDLAIDKDCIAYEQGLTKMNETLVSNVRSATRMLQKARLAVLQNQNTYDARGCISALETCMTDDMVCGEDYKKCLDPTKKFVDENGNVVLGKNVNYIQKFMSEYNNALVDSSYLGGAYTTPISDENCAGSSYNDGKCVVKYLLTKIGTMQKATDEGLCRPVLDKCRAYTYDTRGNYIKYNDIVVNYIQRAMVNIKAAQYQIVSDYASTCLSDIATCYNNQVSQLTSWSATAAASSVYNIMRGACRNVALTCGYAVFAADTASCPTPTSTSATAIANAQNTCIESISEIFYQSLLCPDNSVYVGPGHHIDDNNSTGGYVNAMCRCKDDFTVFNGSCLSLCDNGGQYLATGVCSTVSCPANSDNVSESDAEFWGHCKCNANHYWFPTLQACKVCPENSEYNANGTSSMSNAVGYYNYQCVCNDSGDTSNPFFVVDNRLCERCPEGSNYQNGSPRCNCGDGKSYCSRSNVCVSGNSSCPQGEQPIHGGDLSL